MKTDTDTRYNTDICQ